MNKATSNFYLGACFLACGSKLESVDYDDPRHVVFNFSGDDLDKVEHEWDCKSLTVNAREYADALREMKMKIHQK